MSSDLATDLTTHGALVDDFRDMMAKRIQETGISMAELARRSGVGRTYLYRILDGDHTPSLRIAEQIAAVLNFEITIAKKS